MVSFLPVNLTAPDHFRKAATKGSLFFISFCCLRLGKDLCFEKRLLEKTHYWATATEPTTDFFIHLCNTNSPFNSFMFYASKPILRKNLELHKPATLHSYSAGYNPTWPLSCAQDTLKTVINWTKWEHILIQNRQNAAST